MGVVLSVDFTTVKGKVVDYALVLRLTCAKEEQETIRVYDSAHGFNEMHRYARGAGKQTGVHVHRGTLGEGMSAAIAQIETSYAAMIEGWRGR